MVRVLIVLVVIAIRVAEIVLAVLDGVSVRLVVESGRPIIIFSERKLGPSSKSIGLT